MQANVEERLAENRLVNISGLPGCGKSAVLKRFASNAAAKGPILFLKSDRLVGNGWSTFASAIGLRHSAAELLTEISATGTSIVFIDGIDRIRPDQKGIVADLLRIVETDPSLAHWKVLATSRDQGLEAYRAWFPPSFYRGSGIGNVSVNPFSDDEAEVLAKQKATVAASYCLVRQLLRKSRDGHSLPQFWPAVWPTPTHPRKRKSILLQLGGHVPGMTRYRRTCPCGNERYWILWKPASAISEKAFHRERSKMQRSRK